MAVQTSLVQQIPRGRYSGVAFIDEAPLDALERVIWGPIRSRDDLVHAEVALRYLLLHETAFAIWWPHRPNGLAEIFGSLAQQPPAPQLTFNSGDPAIPDAIRGQLNEALGMTPTYVRRQLAAAGLKGLAVAVGSIDNGAKVATWMSDGRPAEIFAPALMDVINDAMLVHSAAVRQLVGYFGGASVSVSNGRRNPCNELLAELDKYFDTSGELGVNTTYDVQLPVFLKVLLHRSASRNRIPSVLSELKQELSAPSRAIFRLLQDFDGASSDVERLDAKRQLVAQTTRLASLLKIDTSLPGRLRGMGQVAEAFARLLVGQVGPGLLKLADAAASSRTINRALTPSLADNLSRMAWSVEDIASEDLIVKHLQDEELRAVRASFA